MATVNGGIRSYLKENEWAESSEAAARSNERGGIRAMENERDDEEMKSTRRRRGRVRDKGTQSFNRAGPLRDEINSRKQFINEDAR